MLSMHAYATLHFGEVLTVIACSMFRWRWNSKGALASAFARKGNCTGESKSNCSHIRATKMEFCANENACAIVQVACKNNWLFLCETVVAPCPLCSSLFCGRFGQSKFICHPPRVLALEQEWKGKKQVVTFSTCQMFPPPFLFFWKKISCICRKKRQSTDEFRPPFFSSSIAFLADDK